MAILKRGLSDIVTNVLIILLVLVAIGIIWLFVRPFIQQGAGGVAGASDCYTTSVEPVSCTRTATSGGTGTFDMVLRRNAGSADVLRVEVQYVDGNGNLKTTSTGQTLNELESAKISVSGVKLDTDVKAFAVVRKAASD